MPRRSPPQIRPGELSRADAEALNEALRDLYRLVGGFSAAAPLTVAEDQGGVSYRLDPSALISSIAIAGLYPTPPPPTGLSAAAVSGSDVSLAFTLNSGAVDGVAWYSTSVTGPWTRGPEGGSPLDVSGLSPATAYYFVVTASNGTGGEGPWDGPVSATTMSIVSHTTDSILVAGRTTTHTTDSILVVGRTSTHTTDSILIGTRTVAHTTDSLLSVLRTAAHTTDSLLSVLRTNTHTTDSILVAGRTTTHTTDSYIHHALTGPATSPAAGSPTSSTISVTWTNPSGSSDANVYQSTDGVTYSLVGSAATSPYTATGLSSGTLYYYTIYALNADGDQSLTAAGPVSATTSGSGGPSRTPLGTATNGGGGGNVTISSVTVAAGTMVVVGIGCSDYTSTPTVRFGGLTLSFQNGQANNGPSGYMTVMVYSGVTTSNTTATISISGIGSGNGGYGLAFATAITGLTSNLDDQASNNSGGGGSTPGVGIYGSQSNELAAVATYLFANDASTSFSIGGSSWTGSTIGQSVSSSTFQLLEAYTLSGPTSGLAEIYLSPSSTSYWAGAGNAFR